MKSCLHKLCKCFKKDKNVHFKILYNTNKTSYYAVLQYLTSSGAVMFVEQEDFQLVRYKLKKADILQIKKGKLQTIKRKISNYS